MRSISWVVLTQGTRTAELARAVESLLASADTAKVVVWCNGVDVDSVRSRLPSTRGLVVSGGPVELGIPGGRHAALDLLEPGAGLVGFLDDDARLQDPSSTESIVSAFERPDVAVVTLRLVDEQGETARRHVPRSGSGTAQVGGAVATFLGGACVIRRAAYTSVGGYWVALRYGHEELDLAWRLADAGHSIVYLPDVTVFHPRTEISRHEQGWERTGRNRVLVARRNLPVIIAALHVTGWLAVGTFRAPRGCRAAYVRGWCAGWRSTVDRRPIRWRTVLRLARLGRPPIW